jgi:hypothetical protein
LSERRRKKGRKEGRKEGKKEGRKEEGEGKEKKRKKDIICLQSRTQQRKLAGRIANRSLVVFSLHSQPWPMGNKHSYCLPIFHALNI